nr:MAG TPA: hypothetical protein [Bacteriophage sp.]
MRTNSTKRPPGQNRSGDLMFYQDLEPQYSRPNFLDFGRNKC